MTLDPISRSLLSDGKAQRQLPVSVVVPTLNEERNIGECLASLDRFDQVVVLDSSSTDATVALAASVGAEVVDFRWNGKYPKKKQWALDNLQLRNDWVLFVDADERVSSELADEIGREVSTARSQKFGAFDVNLDYAWRGRRLRHGHRVKKRILVNRKYVRFPTLDDLDAPGMGEQEGHYQPLSELGVGELRSRLIHDDQDALSAWFSRHNRYSDWEAYLRRKPTTRSAIANHRSAQGKLFERLPAKPLVFFVYSYFLRRGFLDGRAGFEYACALSFYYFMISVKSREGLQGGPVHTS